MGGASIGLLIELQGAVGGGVHWPARVSLEALLRVGDLAVAQGFRGVALDAPRVVPLGATGIPVVAVCISELHRMPNESLDRCVLVATDTSRNRTVARPIASALPGAATGGRAVISEVRELDLSRLLGLALQPALITAWLVNPPRISNPVRIDVQAGRSTFDDPFVRDIVSQQQLATSAPEAAPAEAPGRADYSATDDTPNPPERGIMFRVPSLGLLHWKAVVPLIGSFRLPALPVERAPRDTRPTWAVGRGPDAVIGISIVTIDHRSRVLQCDIAVPAHAVDGERQFEGHLTVDLLRILPRPSVVGYWDVYLFSHGFAEGPQRILFQNVR